MKQSIAMLILCVFLASTSAYGETFDVEHNHFRGGCRGRLVFGDKTVEYVTDKLGHSRSWKYEDIQQLAIAPDRITILTYHSRKIELGADQAFHFMLLSGAVTDRFRTDVSRKLARPLVSGVLPEKSDARFVIPARHKRFPGGSSQGDLEFGEEYVAFRTGDRGKSRIWRYDELLSLGSTGPFRLRIGALEKTGGEYGEEKNYVFDLKRRMKTEEYDFVWDRIYRK